MADQNNNRIRLFSGDGVYLTQWGTRGRGIGQFDSPGGLAADSSGAIYVADTFNNRIQVSAPAPAPLRHETFGAVKNRFRSERRAAQSGLQDR